MVSFFYIAVIGLYHVGLPVYDSPIGEIINIDELDTNVSWLENVIV